MFGSILGLVGDVVEVATAPVKIAASAARVVTKPVAEMARELVEDIEDKLDDD